MVVGFRLQVFKKPAVKKMSNFWQQKQLHRAANSARSLRSISQQVSAYTSVSTQPSPLPSYVRLESDSQWLSSALTCSAFESVTLPTRLTAAGGRRGSFALFENVLNTNGQQNIFELGAGVPRWSAEENNKINVTTSEGNNLVKQDQIEASHPIDIDYAPRLDGWPGFRTTEHLFSRVETNRGIDNIPLTLHDESDYEERRKRLLTDETILEVYVPADSLLNVFNTAYISGRYGTDNTLLTMKRAVLGLGNLFRCWTASPTLCSRRRRYA